jgi:predicted flap endonuclease-1-like 5' DNA nuclease
MAKDPYHIDLDAFPLARFKQRLATQEVLPARQILKEDLVTRFDVLAAMGLHSLADLIAALRTRAKVEAFARESGLSRDYLVILGRQARSYKPKPVVLGDIPGVDPEHAARLAAEGIKHSKHLFQRGQTPEQRQALAEATGVPRAALLELVQLADLARILGLGPVLVRLYHTTGAETVEAMARWDPVALDKQAHAVNQAQGISKWVPPRKDAIAYVEMAQALPKVIDYG